MVGVVAAQPVRSEFTGTVTQIDDPSGLLQGAIHVGDPVSGRLSYDLSAPGRPLSGFQPGSTSHWYFDRAYGIVITVAGHTAATDAARPNLSVMVLGDSGGQWSEQAFTPAVSSLPSVRTWASVGAFVPGPGLAALAGTAIARIQGLPDLKGKDLVNDYSLPQFMVEAEVTLVDDSTSGMPEAFTDSDADGVTDSVDLCPGTIYPETLEFSVTNEHLAVIADSPYFFLPLKTGGIFQGGGTGNNLVRHSEHTLGDTRGCTCTQMLAFKSLDPAGKCSLGLVKTFGAVN
jgi:hypothetical protein